MRPYRPINKHLSTIRKILSYYFRQKKSDKTIRPPVIPFRKVLDGIVYILKTGCQWKEYGSGSTCHTILRMDSI